MIIPLTKSEMRKRLRHTSEINQYNLAFNTVVQKTFVLFCIFDSLRTSIEKNEEKKMISFGFIVVRIDVAVFINISMLCFV